MTEAQITDGPATDNQIDTIIPDMPESAVEIAQDGRASFWDEAANLWADVRTLAWLRYRQFRGEAIYWLRVVGYEPNAGSISQKLYILYLLAFFGFWLATVFTFIFQQAQIIGAGFPVGTAQTLLNGLPYAVLAVQIYVLITALRSTPLKLTFPDIAYVSGTPVERGAPFLLGFTRQVIIRYLLFALIIAIFAALINYAQAAELRGAAMEAAPALTTVVDPEIVAADEAAQNLLIGGIVRSVAIMLPLILSVWGVAWVVGTARLVYPALARARFLWLLPLMLIPLALVVPEMALWQGRGLASAMTTGLQPVYALALVILSIVFIGLIAAFGNRANLVMVNEESTLYARIQALGILAWTQPRAQARVRLQTAQAGRTARFRLLRLNGFPGLAARAALSYIRHPFMLLVCALWGAAMTMVASLIAINNLPAQIWIGWLLIAGLTPPPGLLHVFTADAEERFLRQFIPVNGLELLFADVILPLFALIVGAFAVWSQVELTDEVRAIGILFIPVVGLLLALCGAYSLTKARVLQTRLFVTFAAFGIAMVAGVLTASWSAALGIVVMSVVILSGLIAVEA